jgi:hypothetical protein
MNEGRSDRTRPRDAGRWRGSHPKRGHRMAAVARLGAYAVGLWVALGHAGEADACETKTLCIGIDGIFDDMGAGDYPPPPATEVEEGGIQLTTATMKARGVRVLLLPPVPEDTLEIFADEEGCFSFESQYYTGFEVVVYPMAALGEAQNIRVYLYDEPESDSNSAWLPLDPFVFRVTGLGTEERQLVIPASLGGRPSWQMFGGTLEAIHRIDTTTSTRIQHGASLSLQTYDPVGGSEDDILGGRLQQYNGVYSMFLKPYLVYKKFVIAHEVGHWFHFQWAARTAVGGSAFDPFDRFAEYMYPVRNRPCHFIDTGGSNSLHGLRSAEYTVAAFREGLAHMLATVAWNVDPSPDALFKYYKTPNLVVTPQYADMDANDYMVSMLAVDNLGGPVQWVQTQCETDWSPSTNGEVEVTSSLEWLRFWWQFLEREIQGTPQPGLSDLVTLLQLVADRDKPPYGYGYLDYLDELANDPELSAYETRFEDLAAEHGVYNGN